MVITIKGLVILDLVIPSCYSVYNLVSETKERQLCYSGSVDNGVSQLPQT